MTLAWVEQVPEQDLLAWFVPMGLLLARRMMGLGKLLVQTFRCEFRRMRNPQAPQLVAQWQPVPVHPSQAAYWQC